MWRLGNLLPSSTKSNKEIKAKAQETPGNASRQDLSVQHKWDQEGS